MVGFIKNKLKTHKTMKATKVEKTFKITLEGTEDEFRDLLFSLQDYKGYGAVEDLEKILLDTIGPEEDEDEEDDEKQSK